MAAAMMMCSQVDRAVGGSVGEDSCCAPVEGCRGCRAGAAAGLGSERAGPESGAGGCARASCGSGVFYNFSK